MPQMAKQETMKVPTLPWMRNPIDVENFENVPLTLLPRLDSRLQEALEKIGISSLFPVQVAVWDETVGPGGFERDLCINSPTGSGKTLSYALPIVQMLRNPGVNSLKALVVLPTRDLALQVKSVFSAIAPAVGLSVGLAVGQSSIADEISCLIKSPNLEAGTCIDPKDNLQMLHSSVDILVATPGRLMDHINTTRGFSLEHLQYLVVDETDRLLREAYQSWLPTVLKLAQSSIPAVYSYDAFQPSFGFLQTIRRCGAERGFKDKPYPRVCKMVLSATLTQDPSKLAELSLHHPLLLSTGQRRYQLPETLKTYKLICELDEKPLYLVALLQNISREKTIVFTSSKETTHKLCDLLNLCGDLQINFKEYSGRQRQSVRSKTLEAFRAGKIDVLISSDAMTRGMDVREVENVINYDRPLHVKTYIHRAGRTARAGLAGRCFTLVPRRRVKHFEEILQKAGNASVDVYSLPSVLIEKIRPIYDSALKRMQETGQSKKRSFPVRRKSKVTKTSRSAA